MAGWLVEIACRRHRSIGGINGSQRVDGSVREWSTYVEVDHHAEELEELLEGAG